MEKLKLPQTKKGLKWYTAKQVFGKSRKSRSYRTAYNEELARLMLAKTVRESRLARKMTQEAIARKINMPQSVIARLESGTHSVSLDTLSKIALALGKRVELV